MSSSKNLEFKQQSFLNKSNSQFIEEMYVRFIENDPELPDSWKTVSYTHLTLPTTPYV